MDFRYFEAPESEMLDLLPGQRQCDLCGERGRCFRPDRALGKESVRDASVGCIHCLQDGRFGFFHITEAGYLDEDGLTWYGQPPMSRGRVFVATADGLHKQVTEPHQIGPQPPSDSAMAELRRTPDFATWNEVSWPLHCDDFMVYLGSWQPADVADEAKRRESEPRLLFESMVDLDSRHLWSDASSEWGVNFLAFRCVQCGHLRGVVDLD